MANANVQDQYSLIKTMLNENTKRYTKYDGAGRAQFIYEAKTEALPGEPCLLTEYVYKDLTSFVVKATKETNSKWDEASEGWDAEFTTT